jgi:hypothetical protein
VRQAKSSFVIDRREVDPVPWDGGQMSRTRIAKTFTGDVVGTSVVETVMLGTDNGGPAVYVGIERFDVTVHGHPGTFLMTHTATMYGDEHILVLAVVPGSGTGALQGISGTGQITPDHDFVLDYAL